MTCHHETMLVTKMHARNSTVVEKLLFVPCASLGSEKAMMMMMMMAVP